MIDRWTQQHFHRGESGERRQKLESSRKREERKRAGPGGNKFLQEKTNENRGGRCQLGKNQTESSRAKILKRAQRKYQPLQKEVQPVGTRVQKKLPRGPKEGGKQFGGSPEYHIIYRGERGPYRKKGGDLGLL